MFFLGQRRNLISAAASCRHFAVGNEILSGVQTNLLRRPINLVADTIGKVSQSGLPNLHHMSFLKVESRVMFAYHRVVRAGVTQFFGTFNPSRNHGVRINYSLRFRLELICGFQRHRICGFVHVRPLKIDCVG
jgi:hypothetical protein